MPRGRMRAAGLLLTVLIATGCIVQHSPSPKPAITAEVARQMALQQFPSTTPVTVVFVRLTTIGAAMEGTGAPDKSAPAWAVRLVGSFYDAHVCAPDDLTPPQCGPHPTTALLVIDARTGDSWGAMPAP